VCVIAGPPHVWGAVPSSQTFRLGDTVKLDCPIRANPPPILEWLKDGDSIKPGWERYKPTNHGLRIKGVLLDDTGYFTCKGVNGFGSEQVTFHVQIIGKLSSGLGPWRPLPPNPRAALYCNPINISAVVDVWRIPDISFSFI